MKHLITILSILYGIIGFAQISVTAKGVGKDRKSALDDALRNAVGQVGTKVISEVKVQNYQLLDDVIKTRTEGYIQSYEIINETPFPDRYEVEVRAVVSMSQVDMDAKTLAQWLEGLRFMVVYYPTTPDKELYEYAYDRANEYLARLGYRYVEKGVFDRLKDEAVGIAGVELSGEEFAKKLAFYADAEFFIFISKISFEEMGLGITSGIIDLRIYDNCTAEGLAPVVGEGQLSRKITDEQTKRTAIDGAIYNGMEKAVYLILQRLGEWCNNGAPFELRFYGIEEDAMDELADKLRDDTDFGGQFEPIIAQGYWRLNCTFKKSPYEMRRKIREYARSVPAIGRLETKLQYVRQISFGLPSIQLPEAKEKAKADSILMQIQR